MFILEGDPRHGKQLARLVASQAIPPGNCALGSNCQKPPDERYFNRDLLEAGKLNPGLVVLTLSQQKFHPELGRAMQKQFSPRCASPWTKRNFSFGCAA